MAMASIPPGSRTLESLAELLRTEYPDLVKEANYVEGPPEFISMRCKGVACPSAIAAEVGRSGFRLNTFQSENSFTVEVIVLPGEQ